MKAFKVFIKPFEAPQRSAKIKLYVNFFSSSGIGMRRLKILKKPYLTKLSTRDILEVFDVSRITLSQKS